MENKIIIGVDLGGTKIMIGAVTNKGKVIGEPLKIPTKSNEQPNVIVQSITDTIEKLLKNLDKNIKSILSIGIGSTGPLDIDNGIILECPQLPTMHFFHLRNAIEEHFSVPVFMNNDANCLIYGESILGAGLNKTSVVGFTLGTGIGCAIVLDGKLLNGATGTAGEVWTSPYGDGIIEDFISGDGVVKIYKKISGQDKTSLEVHNLAKEGDKNALKTWSEFGEHLAVAIAWSVNLIDPEVVILGGSIAKAYKYFEASLEENLRKKICAEPAKKTKVVIAELGDYAGFIGAACLGLEKYKKI